MVAMVKRLTLTTVTRTFEGSIPSSHPKKLKHLDDCPGAFFVFSQVIDPICREIPMKLKLLIAATLLFVIASCSRAEKPDKWVLLSADSHGKLYYTLEKMSKSEKNIAKVWVKTVFNEIKHVDEQDISYSKNLYMINCSDSRFKINIGFNFSADNKVLSKTSATQEDVMTDVLSRSSRETSAKPDTSANDEYLPIAAGSPAERLYGIVCKQPHPPATPPRHTP